MLMVEKRLDKLDDAFLFTISVVGLLFTIVQAIRTDGTGLIEISPLLILGVALPFYIGYLRGAIYDSLIERVRGWIYLIVGASAYCAFLSLTINSYATFLFVFLAIASIQYMEKWFKSTFNFEETATNMYAFSGTVVSSFALAYSFIFFTKLLGNQSQFSLLIVQILVAYVGFLLVMVSEKLSRQVQNANLNLSIERIQNEVKKEYPKKAKFLFLIVILAAKLGACGIRQAIQKAKVFFGLSFSFLLSGSFLLTIQKPFLPEIIPDILLVVGMLFLGLALIPFLKLKKIDFKDL